MTYKSLISFLSAALLFCSCSQETITESTPVAETTQVNLQISLDSWTGTETRAAGEPLTPVTLLLVENSGSTVVKRKVVENDDYTLEVPNGDYEIFAVCGLPEDNVPDDVLESIIIPASETNAGMTDFAVGSAMITNNYGKLSSSSVSITAKRQMAWLTVKINDMPDYFSEVSLNVRGLGEAYNIAEGWSASEKAQNVYTRFGVTKKPGKNYISVDLITIPCTNKTDGTDFIIMAKTTDNKTLIYKYISTTPLVAGKHLTLNLSVSDLALVSETITTEDWDEKTENGTLSNPTVE